jgi:hypothetical protein
MLTLDVAALLWASLDERGIVDRESLCPYRVMFKNEWQACDCLDVTTCRGINQLATGRE